MPGSARGRTRGITASTPRRSRSGPGRSEAIVVRVLTVNVGSSSIKLRLVEDGRAAASADIASGEAGDLDDAAGDAILEWDRPDAVAHRIVHGGTRFRGPVLLDDAAIRGIEELA